MTHLGRPVELIAKTNPAQTVSQTTTLGFIHLEDTSVNLLGFM